MISERDRAVYARLRRAADRGEPCPDNREIVSILGAHALSSGTKCLNRLERAGMIDLDSFAVARVVRIKRTGKSTRKPKNMARHWRSMRTAPPPMIPPPTQGAAPSPPIGKVVQDHGATAHAIQREAFKLGVPIPDFLSRLTGLGWQQYVTMRMAANLGEMG